MNPFNNVVSYDEGFMSEEESNELFTHLLGYSELTSMMEMDTVSGDSFKFNFGKMMFIDQELLEANQFPESTWGKTMPWSEQMKSIKKRIEKQTNQEFRTCVCIFYPDGNSGVDYHSDKPAFGDTSIIPAISLGEERPFYLRENETMKESAITLKHGSLLIMNKGCQENFEHSLPTNPIYKNPRISLTFRKFGD